MIARLEQKILVFGYTIGQGLTLVVITLFYLMIFNAVMGMFGFLAAFIIGIFVIGTPAVMFKTIHSLPEKFFENWFYYHLMRPDIYLPGRGEEKTNGK